MSSSARKLSLRKRLLFQLVIVLFCCGLLEIASFAYLNSTYASLLREREFIAKTEPKLRGRQYDYPMMIHPYIGVVFQPRSQDADVNNHEIHLTEYGFFDDQPPLRKPSPDRVVIALMGGSVARQLATKATDTLEQELSRIAQFQGKKIDFVRLAIDGNKQPQQLMTLNYLLTLGGHFDLVINLDGVNEIALPSIDNVPFGVAAAFPRKWGTITAAAASREMMRTIGYQTYLRSQQRDLALWFESSVFKFSPTACWIWKSRNSHLDQLHREQYFEMDLIEKKEVSVCSSGPREHFNSQQELLAYCAEVWARSSEMMHDLCQANRIHYFHFLQPNQYVADSKPMSDNEAGTAITDKSPFAAPLREGYPMLRDMDLRLKAAGVEFTDLTQIFANHPDPVYKDDCCHFENEGDTIIANAISDRIKQFYAKSAAKQTSSHE